MRVCLLTYDAPHFKTAQVFHMLANRGITDVDFLLMPFVERPKRDVVFSHRPEQFVGVGGRDIAKTYNRKVFDYSLWHDILNEFDHFLVCGSNLIEREFVNSANILNVHSGLIPNARGLDSFKWSILLGKRMGNTLHQLDEFADAGQCLAHVPTPLYSADSLETFAARHYENEIWMLGNFDLLLAQGSTMELDITDAKMRMPIDLEHQMMSKFEEYKQVFAL